MAPFPFLRVRVRTLSLTSICIILVAIALVWTSRQRAATTITVNSLSDATNPSDGLCTLREAITAANSNAASGAAAGECVAGSSSGSDVIDASAISGTINLTGAPPNISTSMTITGPGSSQLTVRRNTGGDYRIFTVSGGATVIISGLTATNGKAADKDCGFHDSTCTGNGGGINNSGNLTLTDVAVIANHAGNGITVNGSGGFGGGISSTGTLTMTSCSLSGNIAGRGGDGQPHPGSGGWGGGIFANGALTMINSSIDSNTAGSGGDGEVSGGNGGHGGHGGGISSTSGTITLTGVTITNNHAGEAGNGMGGGGYGGGIGLESSGVLTISDSTIAGNAPGGQHGGSNGGGGGIAQLSVGTTILNRTTVSGNVSQSYAGGVYIGASAVGRFINCTVSGNNAQTGGGLWSDSSSILALTNTTVTGNSASGSGNGISAAGGGVTRLRNTIVALNGTTGDINGAYTSQGHNLIGKSDGSSGFTNGNNGDQVGTVANPINPQLGPLANNGGPTQTHALLSNSPALDAGDNCVTDVAHCGDSNIPQLLTDQRGTVFNRLVDGPDADTTATVDIGAYETQVTLANIADTSTFEDTQVIVPFDGGDTSTITSVTASSSNPALVPNDSAHLSAAINGSTGIVTINPATNANGTTNITVTVNRTGGSDIKTFLLTVTAVNDAPSFTKGADQTVNEDAGAQTVNWATNISAGAPDESGQTLTFQITGNTNLSLFSVGPAISSSGALTYTPAANANGSATITVNLKDDGGIANGGADTSASQTFTITVNAVNDAPSFTKGPDKIVNEDSGSQFFAPWATGISAGPSDESGQTLTLQVTNNTNAALFSSGPAVNSSGQLSFTPATNANGSATVTIVLKDSGGTANGGVDTSAPQTFTITVNPVNDAPSFTRGSNQTVNEDAGAQTVPNWATSISAGPADESSQTLAFQIVSNSNASLFSAAPAISPSGTLTYTPAADANGTATININLKDNGGTANGGIDTSNSQSFTITVNAVNDAPSFMKGPNQTVNEEAGAQTVSGWATTISTGPANESGQTLAFTATNDNNALFSVQPAISSTGTLTYTPAANANGVANLSVTLKDSGGTANGGVDTSAAQTFTITVNSVNDAPSFTKGADQTVNNNAGAQTVTNWATNISPGPANESGQAVTFQISANTNPGLFSVAPAVSSTGTLTYTPATSQGGAATLTISLKDDGGTANGGVDTSSSQSFNITIVPIGGAINFTTATLNPTEDSGLVTVVVKRTGDISRGVTVDYATSGDNGLPCSTANGVATPKCDFIAALGTLSFAPSEDTMSFEILINQDSFIEGPESLTVSLSNPTGGSSLGSPATVTVNIADDLTEPSTNTIDDADGFVRQQYHDFLNREADGSGLAFWVGEITSCGSDAACIQNKRVNVSAAFFLSIEFQQTGYLVEKMYKAAYGDAIGVSSSPSSHQLSVPIVRFDEFLRDTQRLQQGVVVLQQGWEQVLEGNKQSYARDFVQTSRFVSAFPATLTPAQFVDKMFSNTGVTPTTSERTKAINEFGAATTSSNVAARARALRDVAESSTFNIQEFSRAFVLMEYFGYLRRNPSDAPEPILDYTGYEFWLKKLNQFNGDYIKAEMVKAFISSDEYRKRFGP